MKNLLFVLFGIMVIVGCRKEIVNPPVIVEDN